MNKSKQDFQFSMREHVSIQEKGTCVYPTTCSIPYREILWKVCQGHAENIVCVNNYTYFYLTEKYIRKQKTSEYVQI